MNTLKEPMALDLESTNPLIHHSVIHAGSPMIWVDGAGRIVLVNQAACGMLGYSEAELGAMSLIHLPADGAPDSWRCRWEQLERDRFLKYEDQFRRKTAPAIPVEISASYIDHLGRSYAFCLISDISQRKQEEERLRQSEGRYRQAFETSPNYILITRMEDGQVIEVNQSLVHSMGLNRAEIIGRTELELGLWNDPEQRKRMIQKLEDRGRIYREEVVLRGAWGEERLCEISAERVQIENQICQVSIIQDITDRKRVEMALVENEQHLHAVFDQAYQMSGLLAPDGTMIRANATALAFIGAEEQDVVNRPFWETPWWQHSQSAQERVRDAVARAAQGEIVRYDSTHEDNAGRVRVIDFSIKPVRDAHRKVIALLPEGRDITDHVRAKEQAELQRQQLIQADKMTSLGLLVAGVAHEINNPNGYIRTGLEVIQPVMENAWVILDKYFNAQGDFRLGQLDYSEARAEIPEILKEMREGTHRISRIVGELRDFARQQPSDLNERVDFNSVVESAITLVSNVIRKSTVRFEETLGSNLPDMMGNHQRLEQVVVNLLVNACQALTSKDQAVRVRTRYDLETNSIGLILEDEGMGIAEDCLSHVTDPFYTTKRDEGGTGLGLSVSAGIVADHQGQLTFRSELGKGTIVTMSLPVNPIPPDADHE